MGKILKIDGAIVIPDNKIKIIKYIFNDNKIVHVNAETNETITKNVPKLYTDLISLYSANNIYKKKNIIAEENDEEDPEKEEDNDDESAQNIRKTMGVLSSGYGAGLGILLGILLEVTIIGSVIAGFFSFDFLNDISNKDYLLTEDPKKINFRKGFYASATFGPIVAIACCSQWKDDMLSVLLDKPTRASQNRHQCYKTWVWINLVLSIFYTIVVIKNYFNPVTQTRKSSSNYYYHSY